ncbi:DUF2017 domain-containing protein [Actinacidiphila oryziradicis]|jgi:hypothetical protein|uniref:DUF2017 domain-containing protein n=1 Tax=Actinacidiphila oryziradicis TaxID=2571141 RepID=A0A4U0SV61_9ACTN|nr:DUF2017 domain-containing protein [Actinacidiphila oryziradicis]MCW2874505.1 hypothetical protein [Actinacidiphila oryziradicis]TKA13453.1 DUF2017 domain-containing protein [Actinacidiphila oryziradicis]
MTGYFQAVPGDGAAIALDEVEISILRSLAVQLLELIGPGKEPQSDDPLAELFAEGPSKPPADPALARLFPDAYEDDAYSAEFRRFTENDLRTRKRDDALAVVRSLDSGGPVVKLTVDEAQRWLGALNDLRLTIGTRLEVTEDDNELYRLPDSDPRKPMVMAYLWLGGLQESLVEALMK